MPLRLDRESLLVRRSLHHDVGRLHSQSGQPLGQVVPTTAHARQFGVHPAVAQPLQSSTIGSQRESPSCSIRAGVNRHRPVVTVVSQVRRSAPPPRLTCSGWRSHLAGISDLTGPGRGMAAGCHAGEDQPMSTFSFFSCDQSVHVGASAAMTDNGGLGGTGQPGRPTTADPLAGHADRRSVRRRVRRVGSQAA